MPSQVLRKQPWTKLFISLAAGTSPLVPLQQHPSTPATSNQRPAPSNHENQTTRIVLSEVPAHTRIQYIFFSVLCLLLHFSLVSLVCLTPISGLLSYCHTVSTRLTLTLTPLGQPSVPDGDCCQNHLQLFAPLTISSAQAQTDSSSLFALS